MRYYSDFTHIFTSAGLRETSFLALLMCYRICVLKKDPTKPNISVAVNHPSLAV